MSRPVGTGAGTFLRAAAVAVVALVGCGDAGGPAVGVPEVSEGASRAASDRVGGVVVSDAAVGDSSAAVDAGAVTSVGGGVGADARSGEEDAVGAVVSGGVDDGGGDGDAVTERSSMGGVLVEGVCGWPGPVCVSGEAVAPLDEGGRLWHWQGEWGLWVGRVLDLCDDAEALVSIDGGGWSGGDEPLVPYVMERVVEMRERQVIVCSDAETAIPRWECVGGGLAELQAYVDGFEAPPGPSEVVAWVQSEGLDCRDAAAERRRYVYVTAQGPLLPAVSVEAAVGAYRAEVVRLGGDTLRPHGPSLGYLGREYFVEAPQDALAVLAETVTVVDGAVRGLVLNQSERLWARDVVVTATDAAGRTGVGRFALAVQPGEPAPFEIEGWTGSDAVSEIGFDVSAGLSPRVDLTRSLLLAPTGWNLPEDELKALFPELVVDGELPDDLALRQVDIERAAPTGHPRLAEAALEQTIEGLVVYAAAIDADTGAVLDVFNLASMAYVGSRSSSSGWVEVSRIPVELPGASHAGRVSVRVDREPHLIWAGQAA